MDENPLTDSFWPGGPDEGAEEVWSDLVLPEHPRGIEAIHERH